MLPIVHIELGTIGSDSSQKSRQKWSAKECVRLYGFLKNLARSKEYVGFGLDRLFQICFLRQIIRFYPIVKNSRHHDLYSKKVS